MHIKIISEGNTAIYNFPFPILLTDPLYKLYNHRNSIRQFVTILSLNKTTEERMGAVRPFYFAMNKRIKILAQGALIAAMYVALTYLQNALIPGSASMAIQFRASEALCVLAFFTPAAIPGLTVGCLLFNISNTGAMLLDVAVGSLATLLASVGMYLTRKITVKGYPLLGMLLPAICNGLLIGWELNYYFGGGFWLNGLYVAIGELAVLLSLGSLLYGIMKRRRILDLQ